MMVYWMANMSFFLLGVASVALISYSLDLFLSHHLLWIISQPVIFIIWKLTNKPGEYQPNINILELMTLPPLAADSENWNHVPSSPDSDSWYDLIWKPSNTKNADEYQANNIAELALAPLPAELPETWYDVPSSPASETWYDFPFFPTTTTCTSPCETETFPPEEVKKEMMDTLYEDKIMDCTWNDAHYLPITPSFSSWIRPREIEPLPSEVEKEMVDPLDGHKSMDDTWTTIMEGGKGPAKNVWRQHRRDQEWRAATRTSAKKGLKRPEILLKEEAAPVVIKEEVGWRGREVLVVGRAELFQRVETFIKKHYDNLRIQREESEQRRFFETLRWTA